jgi:hypothetical protein
MGGRTPISLCLFEKSSQPIYIDNITIVDYSIRSGGGRAVSTHMPQPRLFPVSHIRIPPFTTDPCVQSIAPVLYAYSTVPCLSLLFSKDYRLYCRNRGRVGDFQVRGCVAKNPPLRSVQAPGSSLGLRGTGILAHAGVVTPVWMHSHEWLCHGPMPRVRLPAT